jgi:hypothetical protein
MDQLKLPDVVGTGDLPHVTNDALGGAQPKPAPKEVIG